jgi:hypothetical protein
VQVPKLLQPFPIGELLTDGEAAIFGEAEDIELLVVDELRHALFPEILLDAFHSSSAERPERTSQRS